MPTEPASQDDVQAARARLARHLVELQRLHVMLADETRALKNFTEAGRAQVEIELSSELLEQYLACSNGFLENMRGRFEARLTVLRRGDPIMYGKAGNSPGHGPFWLAFSRLCAVLRRAEKVAGS